MPPKLAIQPVAIQLTTDDFLRLIYEELCGPIDPTTGYGGGWPQLGQNKEGNNFSLVDAVARLQTTVDGWTKHCAVTEQQETTTPKKATSPKGTAKSKKTVPVKQPRPPRRQRLVRQFRENGRPRNRLHCNRIHRRSKSGHSREQFGKPWTDDVDDIEFGHNNCDTREDILRRDLSEVVPPKGCHVTSGVLHDPCTGKLITFNRDEGTDVLVQIDHVVALLDAWQTGAQQWSEAHAACQ
jgi:hypothetical protein